MVSNMVNNRHLAKTVEDCSFGEIQRELEYKAEWYGKEVIVLDRFYASSQTCSCYRYKNDRVRDLSVCEWTCPIRETPHDRDVNTAENILMEGLRLLAQVILNGRVGHV